GAHDRGPRAAGGAAPPDDGRRGSCPRGEGAGHEGPGRDGRTSGERAADRRRRGRDGTGQRAARPRPGAPARARAHDGSAGAALHRAVDAGRPRTPRMRAPSAVGFGGRFGAPVLIGPALNPINTTMISVALVPIARATHTSASVVIWLVAGLYIVSSVFQPTM